MTSTDQPTDFDRSLNQARTLCHAIHGVEGSFGLVYMKRCSRTKAVTTIEHSYGSFDEQAGLLAKHAAAGWEPYMMVSTTSEAGHGRDIVVGSRAVAADFDEGLPELLESNEENEHIR